MKIAIIDDLESNRRVLKKLLLYVYSEMNLEISLFSEALIF